MKDTTETALQGGQSSALQLLFWGCFYSSFALFSVGSLRYVSCGRKEEVSSVRSAAGSEVV